MKLATESAWTALLSRRFHSIVVLGKKVFVLGSVAEYKHLPLKHTHTHTNTVTRLKENEDEVSHSTAVELAVPGTRYTF